MKNYTNVLFFLFVTISLGANELSWVDEQIEAIKTPRKGIIDKNIARLDSPFIFLNAKTKKVRTKRPTSYKTASSSGSSVKKDDANIITKGAIPNVYLDAIMNSSALIGGQWYKVNDCIKGYKILSIHSTSVILEKDNRKILLSTNSKNQTLKFKNK